METRMDAESRSLAELVRSLEDRIRAAAARFSLDEADVDEVIQDVRIRLWKARDTATLGATPAGYVYRTAMSAAMDLTRRRRRRRTEALSTSVPAHAIDQPDRVLAGTETSAAILRALDGLSESRRPVVRMYLAGYGSAEIGKVLGWSEPKARNLLYRGLEDLRGALSAMGEGPPARISPPGESPDPVPASSIRVRTPPTPPPDVAGDDP
jgi:RNA polymerase sigma-70 factor (ECF subfamily)